MNTGDDENPLLTLRYKYYACEGKNDRNLDVISDSKIHFSKPSSFNDPFDCMPISQKMSGEEAIYTARRVLKKYSNSSISESEVKSTAERIRDRAFVPEHIKNLFDGIGVLCLGRDPVNQLMWSHYAKNHSGFVLEFDIDESLELDIVESQKNLSVYNLISEPVDYSKIRPTLNSTTDSVIQSLYTKSICWEYEQEERIVNQLGFGLYKYNKNLLKSVVMGARIKPALREKIAKRISEFNSVNSTEVNIYKAKLSDELYKLYIPDHFYFGKEDYQEVLSLVYE